MHEFSIATAIIEQTCAVAREYDADTVTEVHVVIGAHRQVVPEMLETAFDAAKCGTIAESATLLWRETPLRAQCAQCLAAFEPAEVFWRCPNCGSNRCNILTGDELLIKSVVLEQSKEDGATDDRAPDEDAPMSKPE